MRYPSGRTGDRSSVGTRRSRRSNAWRCATRSDRVLADDIVSPIDVPAHDNSAMDGYALRGAAPARGRRQRHARGRSATALAGQPFAGRVEPRECVRIMTGAVHAAGLRHGRAAGTRDERGRRLRHRIAGARRAAGAQPPPRRRRSRGGHAALARRPASCARRTSACSRRSASAK